MSSSPDADLSWSSQYSEGVPPFGMLPPPLGKAEAGPEAEYFLPSLLLALSPEFVVWGSGGLEGSANLCAGLATCLMAMRGRWRGAGVAAAICLLIRPDAAIWLGPSIIVFALRWWSDNVELGTSRLRVLGESLVLASVPVLVHLLWRHSFYGEWLPNTWKVNRHGVDLRCTWGTE